MTNSKLSDVKYKLLQTLWLDIHYGKPQYHEEALKLYQEYKKLGGKSTFAKLRKSQF